MLPAFDINVQTGLKSKVIKYYEFEFKRPLFVAATDFIAIHIVQCTNRNARPVCRRIMAIMSATFAKLKSA